MTTQRFKQVERALSNTADLQTTRQISERMARVRQRDTGPELLVSAAARALGLRFTKRNRDLPGSPDLANRTRRFAVFVHGCYWHRHAGCSKATTPKTNQSFWLAKFDRNRQRDRASVRALRRLGFRVVVIWQCQTANLAQLIRRLRPLEQPGERSQSVR